MADLRKQLRTHLLAKAAVTNLVAQRIFVGNLPRDVTLPAIVIARLADDRLEDTVGDTGLGAAHVLIKGFAADGANADAAAETLIDTVLAADVANYSSGSWGTSPIDDAILTDRPTGQDDPIDGSDLRRRWSGAMLTVWHQT